MNINHLVQILKSHQQNFHSVVQFNPETDKLIEFDFTENNKELTDEILGDEDLFVHYVSEKLKSTGAKYGIGGYDEHRPLYRRSNVFDSGNEEPRRLHLGIDIWGKAHTPVIAPLDGIIHSMGFNNAFGDYGATIILSHQLEGVSFHTLYGHLSLNSLKDFSEGDRVEKGDLFAEFGFPSDNGHWPPHLHFQIIEDMEDKNGDYPGVCKLSEREKYLSNCPDADLILQMMQYATSQP